MAQRHGRMLARLSELSLAACEDLAARAAEAAEPKLAADLHGAFAKAGRCLRQAILLEARLAKGEADRRRQDDGRARQAATLAPRQREPEPEPEPNRHDARQDLLAEVLEDEILEQLEGEAREARLDALCTLLDRERSRPDFLREPIQTQTLRLCRRLGLEFGARPPAPDRLHFHDVPNLVPERDPPPQPPPLDTEASPDPDLKLEPPDPPPDSRPDPLPDPLPAPIYEDPWSHPRYRYGGFPGGSGY